MRAEVLRRDAAGDREHVTARDGSLERGGDLVRIELLPVEVALHERLVRLDHRVEELLAVLGCELGHLVRDRAWLALLRSLRARVRAHVEHVDDPRQLVLGADREVHRDAFRGELVSQRLERAEEVGALAVEHVHEDDAREAELVGELPGARRSDLDAHHGGDRHERPLDDARSAAQLALERRVARDVDEVDLPVLPVGVLERHRDRELTLVLVLVGVRDGRAGLDGAETVDLARSGRGAPRRATSFPSRGGRRRRRCGSLRARAWAGSPPRRLRFRPRSLVGHRSRRLDEVALPARAESACSAHDGGLDVLRNAIGTGGLLRSSKIYLSSLTRQATDVAIDTSAKRWIIAVPQGGQRGGNMSFSRFVWLAALAIIVLGGAGVIGASAAPPAEAGRHCRDAVEPHCGHHAHRASRAGRRRATDISDQHGHGSRGRVRRGQRDHTEASPAVPPGPTVRKHGIR